MAVVLLECREAEAEERQAYFPSKEASQSVLEMTPSVTDGAIFTEI